jgi:hypothetical protein
MKSLPLPALLAAAAAVIALPFSLAAAGTLFLTAWMGLIIHADYALRARRVRLPRRARKTAPVYFRRFAVTKEPHQLAA